MQVGPIDDVVVAPSHARRRGVRRVLTGALVSLLAVPVALVVPADATPAASRTYTTAADFAEGTFNNVVVEGDSITLDDSTTAFPFMWVALSARGTIARIDTLTGQVEGEYATTSDGDSAHNPSRTTVGLDGSVWSGNRNQSSVVHVGLAEANQCVDRNGNGTIDTSTGYGDVRPWPGGSFQNSSPVSNAADECILHYVNTAGIAGGDARHVSVDAAGDIWVGNWTGTAAGAPGGRPHRFEKIDHTTGTLVPGVGVYSACGGYGGLVDGNGVVWSASHTSLFRWDPAQPTSVSNPRCVIMGDFNFSVAVYGLAFDSADNVWASSLNGSQRVHKINAAGTWVASYPTGLANSQGLAIDGNDHVWISSSLFGGTNSIAHLRPDGSFVGHVTTCVSGVQPTCRGNGSTGVAVDADGKIWTANINSNDATRIDPNAGPFAADGITRIGAFDLRTELPGAGPYNYSDMTGATLTGAPESGSWTVVYDSGIAGATWGTVSWNADLNGGTVSVSAAGSNDGVTFGATQAVTGGDDLTVADGRYLKVVVLFNRAADGVSPDVHDVTISTADLNEAPIAVAGGPYAVAEGGAVDVDASGSSDPDGDALTYTWDLDNDGIYETDGALASFSAAGLDGPSSRTVGVQVCDTSNECATATAVVTVTNVEPSVGGISFPSAPVAIGSPVTVSAAVGDPGVPDTHTAEWTWDDGTTSTEPASVAGGASATHTYTAPGIYTVGVTVTDDDGGSASSTATGYIVVYDPAGGFVTGGGHIDSPAGAYAADPALAGRATFGFVSKYQRGATVPTGNTEFQFRAASFNFKSTSYDWLVIAGARAQYKGVGTINGAGSYGFLLTAIDGQVSGGGGTDRFRIKIWDPVGGGVVYDNQAGEAEDSGASTALSGGSIVIHK